MCANHGIVRNVAAFNVYGSGMGLGVWVVETSGLQQLYAVAGVLRRDSFAPLETMATAFAILRPDMRTYVTSIRSRSDRGSSQYHGIAIESP